MDSFHTQHAPFGAFVSFTIGLVGGQGGFGHALSGPAKQNVYVGVRQAPNLPWRMLPFFTPPRSLAADYLATAQDTAATRSTDFEILQPPKYGRSLGWASDRWLIGPLVFKLCTPFDKVPDPATMDRAAARKHLAPVVCGFLEYDNTHSDEPVELMFGLGSPDGPWRPLEGDGVAGARGFAHGRTFAYATLPSPEVAARQAFSPFRTEYYDETGGHRLGNESALLFTVPAKQKRVYPLVLAFYNEGKITTGLTTEYLYTQFFSDLEDVIAHGFANHAHYVQLADRRDAELFASKLSRDQQFLLLQSTHSYHASTQLLRHEGKPLWVVNEGEYRMMNTFDLTVDHLFWELEWHPWSIRNALDLFIDRYSYRDQIRTPDGRVLEGGLSFTHDMGVNNQFSPKEWSSYECRDLHGCFSHMTMEQLLNWVLCAVCYAEKTGDYAWLKKHRAIVDACVESMHRRDDADPAKRDGLLKSDSSRCGPKGAEITTYDSLDVSLGQARNNLYLGVKTLGSWVLLEKAFAKLGDTAASRDAATAADRLAKTLTTKFEADTGFFPAVFENGNKSRILPAVEGFVYALYLGYGDVTDRHGRFGALLAQLARHMTNALQTGVCLDAKSGGWKISSTSHNTWFSKIALAQYAVRKLFPEALNDLAKAGDAVHALWQKRPGCGANAMCDQIHSENGESLGSRYYPRGVSAYLWLLE